MVPGIRLHDETLENALRRFPGHAAYLPSLGCPFCQGHQSIVAVPGSFHVGMPLHAGVHKVGRDNITMRKVSTGADVLNDCHVPASHDLVHSVTDTICGAKLHSHLPAARQHFSQWEEDCSQAVQQTRVPSLPKHLPLCTGQRCTQSLRVGRQSTAGKWYGEETWM